LYLGAANVLSDRRESKGWFFLFSRNSKRYDISVKFWMYILSCSNGSYYVGHTDNVKRRLKEHNAGKGSTHTAKYGPVRLLYSEEFDSETDATVRELQIKRWTKAKKEALMSGNLAELKRLAKQHYR